MNYKYIEQLLERYFQCETSLEEERILRTFFSQSDVPVALLPYRELFAYEQSEPLEDTLGDDFDERILAIIDEEEEKQPRYKARVITMDHRLRPLYRAAAAVAIIVSLGLAAQMPYERQATIDAEQFAAQHAKDTATVIGQSAVAMADSAKTDSMKMRTNIIMK